MKIDFWQLSRDPVEKVTALIAQRVLDSGERLLVVSAEADQRAAISKGLWQAGPESFLANGEAAAT
ncbi:MAG: DNA polymerase III subunit chi, partial [Erythrobacter sp.]|nr:DNA polymerase III subunit chi [Erythrobacter sp.]